MGAIELTTAEGRAAVKKQASPGGALALCLEELERQDERLARLVKSFSELTRSSTDVIAAQAKTIRELERENRELIFNLSKADEAILAYRDEIRARAKMVISRSTPPAEP